MERLPHRPNLEHFRAQAKELLRELRAAEPGTPLGAAQREVASRYGFTSWRALHAWVTRVRSIEDAADRYGFLPRRDFARVRASGEVPLRLIADGALTHPNPAVRRTCVGILDHLGDESILPVLVKVLDDPVPRVRKHALHALSCTSCGRTPPTSQLETLVRRIASSDANPGVRREAAAIARRGTPS